MEEFVFESEGVRIKIYIKDNDVRETVMFVHGLNADHYFGKEIYEKANNFNIITFDFPFKNSSFESFVRVVEDILERVYRGKGLYMVGHSLGGAVVLALEDNPKVKGRILVAPLNPSIVKSKRYIFAQSIVKPSNNIEKVGGKLVKGMVKTTGMVKQDRFIESFLKEDAEFAEIVTNSILEPEFLLKELDALFKKYPAAYVIGRLDPLIPSTLFEKYLESFGQKATIIDGAFHNPFASKWIEMHAYLNALVPYRKAFLGINKFYSKKYLENPSAN